ncbi:ABC transporter substrate-binding protein [Chelativorans sp. Marseille-P2723]|uniref:ABC transporter substrate-binding protein n=1 Tax=Chelativorans sp. Marseille-P2723 TaxID=2709133 RepID=UPI00156FD2BC|nr:ABC transporter substrate-binding protein [Chelativorans sp. Marseille-P2723]
MTINRRSFTKGSLAATVVASMGGSSVAFGISSAAAQAGGSYTYMAPAKLTLFQGYLLAAEGKGFFEEEGVDIKIQPGTGTAVSVQQVSAGAAPFGMAAPIATCAPIADQNAPIISIGQIGYRNFWELASPVDKPLKHPRDWQGKTIGIASVGGAVDLQFDAMSRAVGLDPANVNKVVTGLGPSGYAFLERGEVDGFFVFYESKTALMNDGIELHYLPADDYAPLPADALITNLAFADDPANEEVIVRFLRACRRGIEFMQDEANYEEVVGFLNAYNPIEGSQVEKGKQILASLKPYMEPTGGIPQMRFSEEDWAKAIELLENSGVIQTKGVAPERFYTNRFVDQI